MPKDKISDYSTTANSNTDVGGIGIQGTDPVHNMDNGLREIMSHLADMNEGISPLDDTFTIACSVAGQGNVRFDASLVDSSTTQVLTVPNASGVILTDTTLLDENGKINFDITGNAETLGNHDVTFYQTASNLAYGVIPVERLPHEITSDTTGNASSATNATDHIALTDNPHSVTKMQVGLGSVDDTSDLDKPISDLVEAALLSKADVTALSALLSKDSPQTLTDAQKKQVLANLGLVNNRVVNQVITPHYYAASTDRHIDALDTSIVTSTASSKVQVQAQISYERSYTGAFYLKRNGIEIGSAAGVGSRPFGITPLAYDNDLNATMAHVSFFYEDEPGLAGSHSYEIWIRGSNLPLGLNRTLGDVDNINYARVTSTVVLTESL